MKWKIECAEPKQPTNTRRRKEGNFLKVNEVKNIANSTDKLSISPNKQVPLHWETTVHVDVICGLYDSILSVLKALQNAGCTITPNIFT